MQPVDQHTDDKPPVSIDDDLGDLSALEIHPTLTSSGSGVSADTNHSGTAGGTGSQAEGNIFAESSAACRTSRKHNKPRQQQQQHRRHHREHHLAVKGSIDESNGRGMLYKAIPVMPLWLAVSCCCLNIVIPGTGTMVSAFSLLCGLSRPNRRHDRLLPLFLLNIITSLLQLLTFIVIVGWIWSIIWGMTFIQLAIAVARSRGHGSLEPSSVVVPFYVRRHSSVS